MSGELERMKRALNLGRERSLIARMAGNIASGIIADENEIDVGEVQERIATTAVQIAIRILQTIDAIDKGEP